MGWSGGTYTKGNAGSGGWVGDASLGIGIEASRHDTQDNDFATGINTCLTKDGQNTPTANLGMGGYKHTGVGNATSNNEYVALGQLDSISVALDGGNTPTANLPMGGFKHTGVDDATAGDEYLSYGQLLDVTGAVTTSGSVPAYTVTLTPAPSAYFEGMTFVINPHATLNTLSTSTLNVNGLGAKELKVSKNGSVTRNLSAYEINDSGYYVITYNASGDHFIVHNPSCGYNVGFTPTLSASSGTITVNSNGSTYSWLNSNKILMAYELGLTLSGSTASYITATLPFIRTGIMDEMPFAGWMFGVSGSTSRTLTAVLSGSSSIYFYRGDSISNFPIDSFNLYAMGVYEVG